MVRKESQQQSKNLLDADFFERILKPCLAPIARIISDYLRAHNEVHMTVWRKQKLSESLEQIHVQVRASGLRYPGIGLALQSTKGNAGAFEHTVCICAFFEVSTPSHNSLVFC